MEKFNPDLTQHRAIIGDKVGSGKSYIVLSIINLKRGKNALVIPEHLLEQWVNYVETYGGITYRVIKSFQDLEQLPVIQQQVDLVIFIQLIAKIANRYGMDVHGWGFSPFNRVFYDEIPNLGYLIYQRGTLNSDPIDRLNYFGLIKSLFSWIVTASYKEYENEEIICLKNADEFVDQYMSIPEPKDYHINCYSGVLDILEGVIGTDAIAQLHAGASSEALMSFGKEHITVENLIERFLLEKESDIQRIEKRDLEPRLERWCQLGEDKQQSSDPFVLKLKKEITNLKDSVEHIRNQINEVKKRITEEDICKICYDSKTNCVTECCYQRYCKSCLTMWRTKEPYCPHCRSPNFKIVVVDDNDSDNDSDNESDDSNGDIKVIVEKVTKERKKGDKLGTIAYILEHYLSDNARVVISSDFRGSFRHIERLLKDLNLKTATLDGSWQENIQTVNRFREGQFQVLLLDTKMYGQGLNLEFVTDLISIHHSNNLTQIIGRSQRFGRKSPLNIWKLRHTGE